MIEIIKHKVTLKINFSRSLYNLILDWFEEEIGSNKYEADIDSDGLPGGYELQLCKSR